MPISSSPSPSFLDSLFCCEENHHQWPQEFTQTTPKHSSSFHLPPLDHQDFIWEDEELVSLFTREQQTPPCSLYSDQTDPSLLLARTEAVDWILKVKAHFGFTPLTAIFSIVYLDRFLSSLHFQKDKPWMIHLVAVTCLSLAAKVEETQVPLLLDLQVGDTKYLFEPKNIQKMELLVMSTLQWRMNPVTPISFLDHITRRLGLNDQLHWDFFKKCEDLILSAVSDSRFLRYQPSVLATATMLHVIDQVDFGNSIDYESQLLEVLKTTKEKVKDCYEMVMEVSSANPKKRKHHEDEEEDVGSPMGVMEADFCCEETSTDSDSDSSSPHHHYHHLPVKKMRNCQNQTLYSPSVFTYLFDF